MLCRIMFLVKLFILFRVLLGLFIKIIIVGFVDYLFFFKKGEEREDFGVFI